MDSIETKALSSDLCWVRKTWVNTKGGFGGDITGPLWMIMKLNILKGEVYWRSDERKILPAQSTVWAYIPPYSWAMEYAYPGTRQSVEGVIASAHPPRHAPSEPMLFYSDDAFPLTLIAIDQVLKNATFGENISLSQRPNAIAARAKDLFDFHYHEGISASEIARKLKTSNAVLTRQFKASFGFPPNTYKQGLRVTIGTFALMSGNTPVEAAELAGYKDLSRFYKQFKTYMKSTPAVHQPRLPKGKVKKRQD